MSAASLVAAVSALLLAAVPAAAAAVQTAPAQAAVQAAPTAPAVASMSGDPVVWLVIVLLGIGTFLIRWSFLGAAGRRPVPLWAQRLLRYTAVSVLPGLLAPLVVWPQATHGHPDPMRIAAAAATVAGGVLTRNTLVAILCGGAALTAGYLLV